MNYILDTTESIRDFIEYVKESNFEYAAIDVETDSVNERAALLWGMGFCFQEGEAFYLPIRDKAGNLFFDISLIKSVILKVLKNKKLLAHNGIYDLLVIENNLQIDLSPQLYADTILMKHCVDEERPFGLKEVSVRYLGPWADKAQKELYENIEANGGNTNKDNVEMFKADTHVLGDYCCFAPKSSLVTLSDGSSRYIEDIEVGQKVITHKGNEKLVIAKQERDYEGELLNFEVELGRSVQKVTPEHPFLVLNQKTNVLEWKKAKDIRINDLFVRGEKQVTTAPLFEESKDFWWLLGFYQAEGHLTKSKNQLYTVFSIHQKEIEGLSKVLHRMNLKPCVVKDKRSLGCQVTICSSDFSNKILKYSGGSYKCHDKKITKETLDYLLTDAVAATNFMVGFLEGDGNFRKSGGYYQLRCAVTSASMVSTLDLLTTFLQLNPSRSRYTTINREANVLYFFSDEALYLTQYFRIKEKYKPEKELGIFRKYVRVLKVKKEAYSGKVYNITVDEDNSYISNGIISHNCWDTVLCIKLFNLFKKRLDEEGLSDFFFNEEVMPLYKEVTIPMKKHGFPIDIEHFKKLNSDITKDISLLEDNIQEGIKEVVQQFNQDLLDKVYPAKRGGNFPKVMAELLSIPMPQKNGKTTLAKKAVEEYALKYPEKQYFYNWVLGEEVEIDTQVIRKTQEICYFRDNPEMRYIFNLKSNHHLGWLFFTKLQEKPLSYTENKAPQCDDDFLESVTNRHDFVSLLIDFKKLNKLKSTYIEGILDRQKNDVIYTSMLQFGTTSGRYSSTNPNLQNLPRLKDEDAGLSELVLKYANAIKKGFIAPKGYKLVNADYSALEPRMFAVMSGDANLQQVFINGEDLYSAIAKRVFKLQGSTFKKDADYIGKLYPEKRQQIKTLALAVTYGAEAGRIGDLMGVTRAEAQKLIDDYLNAFPGLRSYIKNCHSQAQKLGYIKTRFGRVRHLELAQKLYEVHGDKLLNNYMYIKSKNLFNTKRVYKTLLNNSTNFPIQGLAAGVVNRAMITMMREFKNNKLNASIRMQVHDEITVIAEESHAEQARKIMKSCMENVVKLEVPLVAEPIIGSNWADVK